MVDLKDLLSTIPIFSFLGQSEITAVESLFVESTHQKGEYVCHEGEQVAGRDAAQRDAPGAAGGDDDFSGGLN